MTDDERVALEAYRVMCPGALTLGDVVCLCVPEAPDSPMVNRVVGLGSTRPATEAALDEAIAVMGDATFYVSLEPHATPDDLEHWLADRGLEPGWGWMRFTRGAEPAPHAATALHVRQIGPDHAADFSRVQRIAYGLPDALDPVLRSLTELPGWTAWIGFDGGHAAAAGALFVKGDVAYFGLGATLPEHRGKGGQGAILAARIEHARSLGCTRLLTETGELRDGLPSNSYRNILRFGFEERSVLRNWLRRRR